MTITPDRLLLWIPRIAGILVSLFIGMFALDAFNAGKPFVQALTDFMIHLVPAFVLLAIAVASFRWPLIGGFAFTALAVRYAVRMALPRGHLDWLFVISGPLLVVGLLFLWSWFRQSRLHAL